MMKNVAYKSNLALGSISHLGFDEEDDVVEHAIPLPWLCGVDAAGVGHGIVVIPPRPRLACVVGMPSPAIRCPRDIPGLPRTATPDVGCITKEEGI